MKPQGLSKQIQREIKAHPVKAGVLALTVVVALWFWAPLLMSWFGGSSSSPTSAALPTTPAAPGGPVAAVAGTASVKTGFNPSWREMVAWRSRDELMRSAESVHGRRDPFRPTAQPQTAKLTETAAAPKIDPTSLGLELTGTLIGPRHSVAMINGRAYTLPRSHVDADREPVHMTFKQQDHTYDFTLLSIEADSVQLEFQGAPFHLRVRDKSLENKKIELNEKSTVEIHSHADVQ